MVLLFININIILFGIIGRDLLNSLSYLVVLLNISFVI